MSSRWEDDATARRQAAVRPAGGLPRPRQARQAGRSGSGRACDRTTSRVDHVRWLSEPDRPRGDTDDHSRELMPIIASWASGVYRPPHSSVSASRTSSQRRSVSTSTPSMSKTTTSMGPAAGTPSIVRGSDGLAEGVGAVERPLCVGELPVERLVVRARRGTLPGHVRQDSRADDGRAVALALPGRTAPDGRVARIRSCG